MIKSRYSYLVVILVALLYSCNTLSNKERLSIEAFIKNQDSIPDQYFEELEKKYSKSSYIKGMRAYFLLRNNNLNKANHLLNSDNYINDSSTYVLMAKAYSNYLQNDSTSADLFLLSLQNDKKMENQWIRLELYYFYLPTNIDSAEYYLDQALMIDSVFTEALLEKNYNLSPFVQCTEIIDLLSKVVRQNYYNANIYSDLGFAYYICNDYDQAKHFLYNSVETEPTAFAYKILGDLYLMESPYQSEEYYTKSILLDTNYVRPMLDLAWVYHNRGSNEEAEFMFKLALSKDSTDTAAQEFNEYKQSTKDTASE